MIPFKTKDYYMKTIITALLLLTSTAFAGGGGSGSTSTFAICKNNTGEELSIMFNDGSGYFLRSKVVIDGKNFYLDANNWMTNDSGFAISFDGPELRAMFISHSGPFNSKALDQESSLTVISKIFPDMQFRCLHQ